jgi:hypothetical protein
MTATVSRLRPREFHAVVPGTDGGPVFYERTLNGAESALVHAALLSAGGGTQYITLTEGRQTWIWRTFVNGQSVPSPDPPIIYPTVHRPGPGDIRPGSPRGHIPEVCSTAKNRAAGRRPRKSPHLPRPQWPGIDLRR